MTKNTETTRTKFQVGDIVSFDVPNVKEWQGGRGIVRTLPSYNWGYEVEVTEVPPANDAIKTGWKTTFKEEWLILVESVLTEDVVNRPSHYTQYPVEVIELTRHMNFGRGNATKYIARAGFKGGPEKELEDLKKAAWYLQDEITQLEKKLEAVK